MSVPRPILTVKGLSMSNAREPLEPLLTIGEAAEVLHSSKKTVRRRIKNGDLPVIRDGRIVRIRPEDLRRYISQRRHG